MFENDVSAATLWVGLGHFGRGNCLSHARAEQGKGQDGALIFWLLPIVYLVDSTVTCRLTRTALASRFQPCVGLLIGSFFLQATFPAAEQRNEQQNRCLCYRFLTVSVLRLFLHLFAIYHSLLRFGQQKTMLLGNNSARDRVQRVSIFVSL